MIYKVWKYYLSGKIMRKRVNLKHVFLFFLIICSCTPQLVLESGVTYTSRDIKYQLRIKDDSTFQGGISVAPSFFRYYEGKFYLNSAQRLQIRFFSFNPNLIKPFVVESKQVLATDSIKLSINTNLDPIEFDYFQSLIIINDKIFNYNLHKNYILLPLVKIDSIKVLLLYNDRYTYYTPKFTTFSTVPYYPTVEGINDIKMFIPFKSDQAYYEIPNFKISLNDRKIKFGGKQLYMEKNK